MASATVQPAVTKSVTRDRAVCLSLESRRWKKPDRQSTYTVTLRRVRLTTAAVEKQQVLHILSVSVALGTQQVTRMRLIIVICGMSGSTISFHIIS